MWIKLCEIVIALHSVRSAMMDIMFIKEPVIKPAVFLVHLLAH